jgi:hypothetical protein
MIRTKKTGTFLPCLPAHHHRHPASAIHSGEQKKASPHLHFIDHQIEFIKRKFNNATVYLWGQK